MTVSQFLSKHSHSTCLSKYIWELKDKGTDHEIKWSIIKRAKPYSGKPSRCNLCLAEKLCLLTADKSVLLNKRSELVTKCRHENKFTQPIRNPTVTTILLKFKLQRPNCTVWWSLSAWNSSNCHFNFLSLYNLYIYIYIYIYIYVMRVIALWDRKFCLNNWRRNGYLILIKM